MDQKSRTHLGKIYSFLITPLMHTQTWAVRSATTLQCIIKLCRKAHSVPNLVAAICIGQNRQPIAPKKVTEQLAQETFSETEVLKSNKESLKNKKRGINLAFCVYEYERKELLHKFLKFCISFFSLCFQFSIFRWVCIVEVELICF